MPTRIKTDAVNTDARELLRVYESISAASAAIGAPEAIIKAAKRKGCKAFISGSRIVTAELVRFLFEMLRSENQLPDGFASWKEVLESEKAKREQIKRQQDERSTMLVADAKRQAGEAMSLVFAELERRDRELPPALAGLPAVEIYKRMHHDTESIRRNLRAKFEAMGE